MRRNGRSTSLPSRQCGHTANLVRIPSIRNPGGEVGYQRLLPRSRRIEISVEDAGAPSKLKLARTFLPHILHGRPEQGYQGAGVFANHPVQPGRNFCGGGRRDEGRRPLLDGRRSLNSISWLSGTSLEIRAWTSPVMISGAFFPAKGATRFDG